MIEWPSVIAALINTGGMGIVAGVLLYLHINTLRNHRQDLAKIVKSFKEELQEERRQCHDDNDKVYSAITMMHQSMNNVCRANPWYKKSQ